MKFASLDQIVYAPFTAADSPIRRLMFRHDHVLFRPYSPRATTTSGLWLQSNPNHPKIWGWLLAVSRETVAEQPGLVPGSMLVVQRAQGESIAKESPGRLRYSGHHFAVVVLPLTAVQLAVNPPLVSMEETRVA